MSNLSLNKVTLKSMKTLKELGLLEAGSKETAAKILEISLDADQLKEACETIFDGNFENTDWEEFDLSEFTRGYNDFLQKFWGKISG